MDHKRSPIRRTKRQAKVLEDNFWDCSVCTYRNTAEAFKCLMCDVRKGTSTRKPRINPQLVAQQVASQFLPATSNQKREKKDKRSLKKRRHPPRLKNIDRSTAQTREVTVNSVTVVITEYKPKIKSSETISSSSSSDHGSQSESSMDAARWTWPFYRMLVRKCFACQRRACVSDSRGHWLVTSRGLCLSVYLLPVLEKSTTNLMLKYTSKNCPKQRVHCRILRPEIAPEVMQLQFSRFSVVWFTWITDFRLNR